MAWIDRLWNVLRPARLRRELDRELAFHLAERTDALEAEGYSADEASRVARQRLGNYLLQRERTRDEDVSQRVDNALRNLRLAARALARTPGFTVTVVATLALGIGANSTVFSAIDAVLLRPLPFPNADRLVTLAQIDRTASQSFVAPVRLADWDRMNSTFQAISGYYTQDESEVSGTFPEMVTRAFVAPRFLEVWGVAPVIGRDFSPAEEQNNGPPAVIISDGLWRRRFHADPRAIGAILHFAHSSAPIVGVMPASFRFPVRGVDLWSPSLFVNDRNITWYTAVGRLKDGVTVEQARANLASVQAELGREFPRPDGEITCAIEPLKEATVAGVRGSLWMVFGAVSLLLLIACTNVAALLLSRTAARRQEIALRVSMGASRGSVAWLLLAEVSLLALVGATLGLGLAGASLALLRTVTRSLPQVADITLDWRLVLYSLACALVAIVVCGVAPVSQANKELAQSARATRSSGGRRAHAGLVGVQVALAVTLLAGAALLVRSFQALSRVSPGFDPDSVLVFQMTASWDETADPAKAQQRADRILERLQSLPGIEAVAVTPSVPGIPSDYQTELATQEPRAASEPKIITQTRAVSPGYFATLRIPLLAGELCREQGAGTWTMMVNRAFANAYFAGSSPIGHHLSQPGNVYVPNSEVRGIVGDAREMGLDRQPVPTVYWCATLFQPGTHFLVRVRGDLGPVAAAIRAAIHEIEPIRSVYDVAPLADQIADAYATNRLRMILLSCFASLAMLLACVGLYGTISYSVNVRRGEIGLRMALGAVRERIIRQFLSQGLLVSGLGCAVGIALALALTRFLSGMLYGVSATDPATLAGVVAIVLLVSLIASLVPAIRASRVEPMQVLRGD
jgi:putative ABC transport system permease protein